MSSLTRILPFLLHTNATSLSISYPPKCEVTRRICVCICLCLTFAVIVYVHLGFDSKNFAAVDEVRGFTVGGWKKAGGSSLGLMKVLRDLQVIDINPMAAAVDFELASPSLSESIHSIQNPLFTPKTSFSLISPSYQNVEVEGHRRLVEEKASPQIKLGKAAEESCKAVYQTANAEIETSFGFESKLDQGGRSLVATVERWRNSTVISDNLLHFISDSLGVEDDDSKEGKRGLSEEGVDYVKSLVPYFIPLFCGLLIAITVLPLALCACCSVKCSRRIPCSCCIAGCCGGRHDVARGFNIYHRIVWSAVAFILGCAIASLSLLGVFWSDKLHTGLSKSQCVMTSAVDITINGGTGSSVTKKKFAGILPTLIAMNILGGDVNPNNDFGIFKKIEKTVNDSLNVLPYKQSLLDSLKKFLEVVEDPINNLDVNPQRDAYHMSVINTVVSVPARAFYNKLDRTFESNLLLIRRNVTEYLNLAKGNLESLSNRVAAVDYTSGISKVNNFASFYLKINNLMERSKGPRFWVTICLHVIVLIVVIPFSCYLVYLFCCTSPSYVPSHTSTSNSFDESIRQRSYTTDNQGDISLRTVSLWPSPKPALFCYMINLICCIMGLLFGGALLGASIFQTDICKLTKDTVISDEGAGRFLDNLQITNAHTRSAFSACFVKNNSQDLGQALGLDARLKDIPQVRSYFKDIQPHVQMPFNQTSIEQLLNLTTNYDWLFFINKTKVTESGNVERLYTYEEVLQSGVQDKGRYLTGDYAAKLIPMLQLNNSSDSQAIIYGLMDVEQKINPLYFQALHSTAHPQDPQGVHMITPNFDPTSEAVLTLARAQTTNDEDYRKYINAVWWAAAKQKLRSPAKSFHCPNMLPSLGQTGEGGRCEYGMFVDYVNNQLAKNTHSASMEIANVVNQGKRKLTEIIDKTSEEVAAKAEGINNDLDCGHIPTAVNELKNVWCDEVSHYAVLVSIIWVLIGALMFACFCMMYLVWRTIEHNRYRERQTRVAAESAYEINHSDYQYA